ncbi:MAG TPA: cytochrome c oxidase subunit I [Gemmatimonadaceae bacterium]|nr:cytochrome c oxidase subunit I [Gemmatimonadaceae bacterium]
MASTAIPTQAPPLTATPYKEQSGVWSWMTTVDHKRIGILYLFTALTFFLIGGLEAELIRIQLQGPNRAFLSAEMYNQIFTMHGTTMIFLAIMPLSASFFNFLIPLQIGARDVAFPRLNAFSYWVYLFGGVFITLPILFQVAPNGGWFGYVPLTTRQFSQGINIDFWVIGLQILGISSLAAAFNFITTIINLRAPGMTLMRMPMFTWMSFVVQFLLVLAFPVITIALVFLLFDRFFGTNFYTITAGADPLLWQHLFWIFGHPEVYILILPAFGLVSEVLPTYSSKPLFGYPVMVYSGILIGVLGFGVWAHHMFAVGMGPIADAIFALSTMLIGIPTGVKIFNWMATMAQGSLRFTTAMLFGIALVALFTIGGISGVMHSSPPADLQQTDTYFIVAHFHYVLFGGSIMGIFAGIYHYFPKITGRLLNETLGKWHFWINFIGMNLTFFPMHFSGMLGMPRRIYTYDAGQGWDSYNLMSSIGAYMLAVATLIFVYNFFVSRKRGAIAGPNPWHAGTLEWSIPSPPPEYNFAALPNVTSRYPLWEGNETDMESARINSQEGKSAEELGIILPYPTIKPMIAALGILVMFCGLISTRVLIFVGAAILVGALYSWLLSPLEPEHH